MSSLLRRRFDSSKCKTLLQFASQRLKILRNKQVLAVKKARVDVAKLLEKGQDNNAKVQVEAVFREEKMLALHDLLDRFCHIVLNGLESIKSQKECPLDLREAVASLIFAGPKCSDIEELKRVSKLLMLKYGAEFSVAAKELRPDCGVNKEIIQSLSSSPPDYDMKLKLLKEIAVENNIIWANEKATADVSKEATVSIDGPNHFASATQLSQVASDMQKSKSMHVNEVKGQSNAVLQNAIGSQTMPATNSLGLPLHDTHQFAKSSTGGPRAMGSSIVSDCAIQIPGLDAYALARAEGKMDYKVVSDYMKRVVYEETVEQLAKGEQGPDVLLEASHREDVLHRLNRKKAKERCDMIDAHRRNEGEELSDLKDAAEYAFASAMNSVEAARAAVNMVRMESLERSKDSQAVNKLQEMQPELSTGSGRVSADCGRSFCEDQVEIDSSQHGGTVGDQISDMKRSALDESEDSFKYVVYEQTSDSQTYTQLSTQAEGYDINSKSREVWSEPTLYSRKSSDRIIFDPDHEEPGCKEGPTTAFYGDNLKELELDRKSSFRNNQERIFYHTRVHEEAYEDKSAPKDSSMPQFDDYSSEEDDYMQRALSVPQIYDLNSEEANEEEEPFYLRGRAAVATEDNANGISRAPHSKRNMLMPTVSFSTDDEVEETSINRQSGQHDANLNLEFSEEPQCVSDEKEEPFFMGSSSGQYNADEDSQKPSFDDYVEPVSLMTQKTPFRRQISTGFISESSIMSPVAYNGNTSKPITPRKLILPASIIDEWDLENSSDYEVASPLGSVKLHSLNENRDPSSQVSRKLNWFSGASEDSEPVSERSFESHELGWNSEDLNLDSSKHSFNMEDLKKIDSTQVTQPANQKSCYGVSVRSVRSNRFR